MAKLKFTVIQPALMIGPQGVNIPDGVPVYFGESFPNGDCPPIFPPAFVISGGKAGKKWLACQYHTPTHTIPGIGTVEEIPY
ncbi:MAG: hypothetical protein WED33_01980 [Bacteroidia bacterium]